MGLALFARWLKANRHTFLCKHIAYLSLRHEGLNHVAKSAVEQRGKVIRFVYSVAGMPYPLPCVVPYDSVKFKHEDKFFVPLLWEFRGGFFRRCGARCSSDARWPRAVCIDALCDQGAGCLRVASASVGRSTI